MEEEALTQMTPHERRLQSLIERRQDRAIQVDENSFVFDEAVPVVVANSIEITEAYFAKAVITKEYEEGQTTYTVASGDNVSKIATAQGTTVEAIIEANDSITNDNKHLIQVGQIINIQGRTERGENIAFEKITTGGVGQEVYIIVETKHYRNGSLAIAIKQGKMEGVVAVDESIPVTVDDERKISVETKVGNLDETEYLNKALHTNKAAVKITLDPADDEERQEWNTKLEALEGKKTNIYLEVEAQSENASAEIRYKGTGDENKWLNEDGKWFELIKCNCCNAQVDEDGFVTHDKFNKEHITALERGALDSVNAIILHRTVNDTAAQTFAAFKSGVGTHFAVDKDGTIYQTASLNQLTYHVGKIKSRCFEEGTCSAQEQATIAGWGWATTRIYNHEKIKAYPDRYPFNKDSVGIEVVGNYINEQWDPIPDVQAQAVACVVHFLLHNYELSVTDDIFEHEDISYKTEGEGSVVYDAIKNLIE